MLFRTRDLLVRQRTQTINALRGHLAEFGIVAPQGRAHVARLAGPDPRISIQARGAPMPHDEAGHTEAPDRMPQPSKENACINGGVHTRGRPHTAMTS